MKLVDTTDEKIKSKIGSTCSLNYRSEERVDIRFMEIWTTKVKQITREGNKVVITTENNTYTLED